MSLYTAVETSMPARLRWRFRAGVIGFLGATYLLAMLSCGRIGGPCVADGGKLVIASVLVLAVEAWVVIALVSGKGRRIAGGFLFMLAITTILTAGRLVAVWALPYAGLADLARPIWAPLAKASARSTAAQQWVGARRAELPTVVHAQRLANAVHECAARYRALDSLASFPRTAAQLSEPLYCADLAHTRAADVPDSAWYADADYGWRWSYVAGPADADGRVGSYAIRVFEDPAIGRPAPQYDGDETGVVRELVTGQAPSIVASPVPALAQLRACLQRVPAQHEADEARYGYPRAHDPLSEVSAVCPELKGHYRTDYPEREHALIAVSARNTPGEFIDTVAVYRVDLILADPSGMVFGLQASPAHSSNPWVHSGVRRFFVARDGAIHATTGQGAAAESDALVAECTAGVGAACGDAPVVPRQAPGS